MSYECHQREYPRLPLGGHLQAKEKGEDPKPPGERQWKLTLVRWVYDGERHRLLRKTRPGGKVLRPHAPLGAKRTRERADLLATSHHLIYALSQNHISSSTRAMKFQFQTNITIGNALLKRTECMFTRT